MPKRSWEVDAKDRFLDFLHKQYGQEYLATREDVPVSPLTQQNYDFELTPSSADLPVIALEIFRLVGDEEDLKHNSSWADMTERLQAEMEARGVAGYSIRTPHFNVPKFKRKQFASGTADRLASAIARAPTHDEIAIDEFVIYRAPGLPGVVFSHIGGIRQIDPFGSTSDALDDLLPDKNEQLNVQGRLRALLIVNSDPFHGEGSVRRYFGTADAEEFANVDRVFFEVAPENICLVFDRRAFDCYGREELPDEEELTTLFLSFLEHRLSSDHKRAVEIIKKVRDRYGNLDRLSCGGRDALISAGESFAEDGEWPSVLWIIEQLKNDADPPFPNRMHDEFVNGKDHLLIASIRGRLCWLMQKVIIHNLIEYYVLVTNILEGYASGPDFYIRAQACVPLAEIARRRRSLLPDGNRFMPEELALRVKGIAFQMLREAGANPVLLAYISTIFQWLRDLSEQEASEVLGRLSAVNSTEGIHNRCALLLYFALFRGDHFAEESRFDSSHFKSRLQKELEGGDPRFRVSLVWLLAAEADQGSLPFEIVRPYLLAFLSGPFDSAAFLSLRRICQAYVKHHREAVGHIMFVALRKMAEYIANESGSRAWSLYQLDEFFDVFAENADEGLVLDLIEVTLPYRPKVSLISVSKASCVLSRYESARAKELKSLYCERENE